MVVASPGNLCKINLNKRQRLRHFLNHKGIRSRFKCTSQSCAYAALSSEPNPFQEYTIDEIVPIRIAVRSVLNLLDDAVNTLKEAI
jgi:hypothetical protein